MWQGILQGMMLADEERSERERLEEARRIREEDVAFRERQFSASQEIARRQMIADLYPRMRELSVNSSALAEQASILSGYFPNNPEIVERLRGTGNTEAIQRVIDSVEAGYIKAQEDGMGQEYLDAWATTISNNARITGATQGELDFSLFEDVVTPEDLTALGLPTSFTVPGRIEVAPVIYQPRATIEELNAIERRIANTAVEQGNREMLRLREATARINEMLSNPNLDSTTEASLRSALASIVDRQMVIEGALDATKGDRPVYSDILNIFGSSATDAVISSSTRRVDRESLSPAFNEATSAQPVVVVSPTHLQILYETGVINDDSVILYEGQEIFVGDIPEREDQ